jgi:hypothetical protein
VEHGGGGPGINALLRIYPRQDISLVVMSNANGYSVSKALGFAAVLVGDHS